jgi:hypothetical protein
MSEDKNDRPDKETNNTGMGIGIGMLFGVALGIVLWQATDNFVFFPVFLGAGMSIGLALGATRDQQKPD